MPFLRPLGYIPTTNPSDGAYLYLNASNGLETRDSTGAIRTYAVGVTPEEVQDIIGLNLQSSSALSTTVGFVYSDPADTIVAEVKQAGIDHTQIANKGTNTHAQIDLHVASVANPHAVTKAQVGLGVVDNTSDAAKPVSTAQAAAISGAIDAHELTRDHPIATQALDGLMSGADKLKLDNFIAPSAVKTTANLTNASNATLVNVTELTMPVLAGKSYAFNMRLVFTSPATGTGIALAVTALNGAAGTLAADASAPTTTTVRTFRIFSGLNNVQTHTNSAIASTPLYAEVVGVFIATASGDIVPQFRSETNGTTITVLAGSTLAYSEI